MDRDLHSGRRRVSNERIKLRRRLRSMRATRVRSRKSGGIGVMARCVLMRERASVVRRVAKCVRAGRRVRKGFEMRERSKRARRIAAREAD